MRAKFQGVSFSLRTVTIGITRKSVLGLLGVQSKQEGYKNVLSLVQYSRVVNKWNSRDGSVVKA